MSKKSMRGSLDLYPQDEMYWGERRISREPQELSEPQRKGLWQESLERWTLQGGALDCGHVHGRFICQSALSGAQPASACSAATLDDHHL